MREEHSECCHGLHNNSGVGVDLEADEEVVEKRCLSHDMKMGCVLGEEVNEESCHLGAVFGFYEVFVDDVEEFLVAVSIMPYSSMHLQHSPAVSSFPTPSAQS